MRSVISLTLVNSNIIAYVIHEQAHVLSNAIPWSFLGALVTAVIALATVRWTNKEQTKRLAKQLDAETERQAERLAHDARQKDADRLSVLRKEIYLQLPLELGNGLENLVNLPLRDTDDGVGSGVSGYARIAAQVSVLSQEDTTDAVMALSEELNKTWFAALKRARPVQVARREFKAARSHLSYIRETREQLKVLVNSSLSKPHILEVITAKFDELNQEEIECTKRIDATNIKLNNLILVANDNFGILVSELSPHIAHAMRMVRRDVGFVEGLDSFEQKFLARSQRIVKEIEAFSADARANATHF